MPSLTTGAFLDSAVVGLFCNNHKKLDIDLVAVFRQITKFSEVLQTQSMATIHSNDFTAAIFELNSGYTIDDKQIIAYRHQNCVNAIVD